MNHSGLGVQDEPGQHSEILSQLKIHKLAVLVVCTCNSSTREAETGELLEPGRRRLQ